MYVVYNQVYFGADSSSDHSSLSLSANTAAGVDLRRRHELFLPVAGIPNSGTAETVSGIQAQGVIACVKHL
jgi:hypothetical protein